MNKYEIYMIFKIIKWYIKIMINVFILDLMILIILIININKYMIILLII